MASAGNLKKGFVMFYRTAGNASFRLSEPRVTHGTPTDTQNEMRACNSCGSPVPAEAAWQKQCSARCRQRAYTSRQPIKTVPYYGA